ncbi:MAG: hypothetical protein LBE17_10715 [Treponema sp.]|nr:hypothetical protein [Treponema sp.]
MKRKLLILTTIMTVPLSAHSLDFALQYYIVSLPGLSTIASPVIDGFESDDSNNPFLIPLEGKLLALRFGAFAMSVNTGLSVYIKNSGFSSLDLSGGISFYINKRETSPMRGGYISLIPFYELPVINVGNPSFYSWKAALDFGLSGDILGPLYASAFSRWIFFWENTQFLYCLPDFGIAAGLHFW